MTDNKTFEYWYTIFRYATYDSENEAIALKNMVTLAETFDEWHVIYGRALGSSALETTALERMAATERTYDEWDGQPRHDLTGRYQLDGTAERGGQRLAKRNLRQRPVCSGCV